VAREELLERLAFQVRYMRDAQRDFFATRSQEALRDSRRLEREVDKTLREIDEAGTAPAPEQLTMFGT